VYIYWWNLVQLDDEINLDIQGNVIALRNLVVALNAKAYFSYNARSGLTTSKLSALGSFSLTNLEVTTDGKLEVAQEWHTHLSLQQFYMAKKRHTVYHSL
jgi:hypothetical protein